MTMSDRIAALNEGKLQQIAPPLECYDKPENQFIAGFIGAPSKNMIDGTLSSDALVTRQLLAAGCNEHHRRCRTRPRNGLDVRTEDSYPETDVDQTGDSTSTIEVRVDVLEPVGGRNMFVYLRIVTPEANADGAETGTEDAQLMMGVDPNFEVSVGDELSVALDREKLHLFDANSCSISTISSFKSCFSLSSCGNLLSCSRISSISSVISDFSSSRCRISRCISLVSTGRMMMSSRSSPGNGLSTLIRLEEEREEVRDVRALEVGVPVQDDPSVPPRERP